MSSLLKPIKMGSMELNNRIVMPPMASAISNSKGFVTDNLINYYKEKTDGGCIGLVIVEHSFVTIQGKASENQLSVADDNVVEGLRKLADALRENGSKSIMQINHAGSAAKPEITGMDVVSASAIENPRLGSTPKELTTKEIKEIVNDYAQAARRTKEAGFDGVEIHSAHGYFLNQFYSPLTNKRTDEYGGCLENRIRLHLEVIKAVKEVVGEDYPVLLRLGASDYAEGGATIEDSVIAAKAFEDAGVCCMDISGGFCGFRSGEGAGEGFFWPLAKAIKEVVNIPVILTGGITTPEGADKLIEDEKTDLIGVGRILLKDSNWAKKAIEILS